MMKVLVSAPARFVLTPDGSLWASNWSMSRTIWARYLKVFDEVRLLARAREAPEPPPDWVSASGQGVVPVPIPYFEGSKQFVSRLPSIRRAVSDALATADAIVLRCPCPLSTEVWRKCRNNRPYGMEIVGDPWDVFSPGSVRHFLRPLFRRLFSNWLKKQVHEACATSFVTEYSLQRRYPPSPETFTTNYSSIELPANAFVRDPRPRRVIQGRGPLRLITVGTLNQLYKAPDVLLDAFSQCVRAGLDLELVFVGDGDYRGMLEQMAVRLDLGRRVSFRGQLNDAEAIRTELDQADLFVLPSRQEGLPRAMIEAMARGLPCLGSTVGGIPELLRSEDLVPPNSERDLAGKIHEVASDPDRMALMSERSLEKAACYRADVLQRRREILYRHVREETEQWLATRRG
jgi:glycosyltransferase involved in cell wall biosynthesis